MSHEFDAGDRAFAQKIFDDVRRVSENTYYPYGVTRPAYSAVETDAMLEIINVAERHALVTVLDPAGNLRINQANTEDVPGIWTGSHLDSVPAGGNYDGLAGVVAGLLCLRKIQQRNIALARPLTVIGLRGEESAWFGKPYLGSSALFGRLTQADLRRTRASVGPYSAREEPQTLEDAMGSRVTGLKRIARGEKLVDPQKIVEFWELHIEQGPVLVTQNRPVGLVTGIRGNTRYPRMQCRGVAGHSGAVPQELRIDAVLAVAEFLTKLEQYATPRRYRDLVFTCGQLGTDPTVHGVTRIPDWVGFSLEWRSASIDTMVEFGVAMEGIRQQIERERHVTFDYGEAVMTSPATMSGNLHGRALGACRDLDLPFVEMASGAGHDAAIFVHEGIPTGMIFIRNDRGSHNPDEKMDIDDFMCGVEVLYKVIVARGV